MLKNFPIVFACGLAVCAAVPCALGQNESREDEAPVLTGHRQLTSSDTYFKAGEAYFSADARSIIYQATVLPEEGRAPSPHYSMFVAKLARKNGQISGLQDAVQLNGPGAATTCGWFLPGSNDVVMYGSTVIAPSEDNQPGYQRDSGRYRWAFPTEMQIVRQELSSVEKSGTRTVSEPVAVFDRAGYTAEGSYSPDRRSILYAQIDPIRSSSLGRPDADLFIYDTKMDQHTPLVEKSGYDGGPFFSPAEGVASKDGKPGWICYRSDRRGDNLLQLFISELRYGDPNDPDRITGITREVSLTNNRHVNWAPFWHPSGRFLIYATSEVSHRNYEVFAIPVFTEDGELIEGGTPVRLTFADGFDGLPVFSPDGELMMWTAQRGDDALNNGLPSSQLWIADVNTEALLDLVFGE